MRALIAVLLLALLSLGEHVSALASVSSAVQGQGPHNQNPNRKLKPMHEAELQLLFPEADQPQISPLAEMAGQISHKWGKLKNAMTYKSVTKLLPILEWLPPYLRSGWKKYLFKDVSAGIVVGIMLVPQAIAYSLVASLPPQYGCQRFPASRIHPEPRR
jgi:hypothetical protein